MKNNKFETPLKLNVFPDPLTMYSDPLHTRF